LVLQSWRSIRSNFSRTPNIEKDIEIRRVDNNGHLCEEHVHGMHAYEASMGSYYLALTSSASLIESEIKEVMENVKKLTLRVDKMEKRVVVAKPKKKKTIKKVNR